MYIQNTPHLKRGFISRLLNFFHSLRQTFLNVSLLQGLSHLKQAQILKSLPKRTNKAWISR